MRAIHFSLAAAVVAITCATVAGRAMADGPKVDKAAVDKAFETLKKFDFGSNYDELKPISEAIVASHDDKAVAKDLEGRLVGVIKSDAPKGAKDFAFRSLRTIGTDESIPAIAEYLNDKELANLARYALERNSSPAAGKALREALAKSSGAEKVGLLSSVGDRGDKEAADLAAKCLVDTDAKIVTAAIKALGDIGGSDAAKALADFAGKAPAEAKTALIDARMSCAEKLLAEGKKDEAKAIYQSLAGEDQPKHVRVGARLGLVKVAASK